MQIKENARSTVRNCSENSESPRSSDSSISFDINTNNPFYCPGLCSKMVDMFTKLPMTGCLMNPFFKSKNKVPTSSATEVGFRTIKRQVMGDKKNTRVDSWLEKHLRFLLGRIEEKDLHGYTELTDEESDVSFDIEINQSNSSDYSSSEWPNRKKKRKARMKHVSESLTQSGTENESDRNNEKIPAKRKSIDRRERIDQRKGDNLKQKPKKRFENSFKEPKKQRSGTKHRIINDESETNSSTDSDHKKKAIPTKRKIDKRVKIDKWNDEFEVGSSTDCDPKKEKIPTKGKEIDEFDGSVKIDEWKGQNKETKPKHLALQRCKNSILNPLRKSTQELRMFQNNSTVHSSKKDSLAILSEMCAFDSIFHSLLAMYLDSVAFKATVDESRSEMSTLIELASKRATDMEVLNAMRSEMLIKFY